MTLQYLGIRIKICLPIVGIPNRNCRKLKELCNSCNTNGMQNEISAEWYKGLGLVWCFLSIVSRKTGWYDDIVRKTTVATVASGAHPRDTETKTGGMNNGNVSGTGDHDLYDRDVYRR